MSKANNNNKNQNNTAPKIHPKIQVTERGSNSQAHLLDIK